MGMKNSRWSKGEGSPNLRMFFGFLILISNNLILPVVSTTTTTAASNGKTFQDGKNYFSSPADPNPPSGAHSNPSYSPSHHHSHHGSTPSSSGGQSNCGVPAVPPPSSGGGGCNCPSPPTPSGGSGGSGGYYHPPSPKTPTHRPSPLVPSPPYDPHPVTPTPRPSSPPPSTGGGGYYKPPPTTPTTPSSPVPSPPVTPIVPSPPLVPSPTPYDPNSPPFPCTYWGSHPALIFGVIGWWATLGGLFGMPTLPGLNSANYSLQDVLNNPRRDGYTSLYREGTASFLNSMATKNFPFSSNQVKASLIASLHSNKAAATQARLFKLANEGKLKVVAASNRP